MHCIYTRQNDSGEFHITPKQRRAIDKGGIKYLEPDLFVFEKAEEFLEEFAPDVTPTHLKTNKIFSRKNKGAANLQKFENAPITIILRIKLHLSRSLTFLNLIVPYE